MPKKSTQATRIRKRQLSDFLVVVTLLIILLLFILFTIQNVLLYVYTNSNNLYEYSGCFELREIQKSKHTTYQFALPNGDIITAQPNIMQHNQKIGEFTELHFLYVTPKITLPFTYNAAAITTLDGATRFLTMNASMAEAKLGIIAGAVLTFLFLALNIIYLLCVIGVKPCKKRKKLNSNLSN